MISINGTLILQIAHFVLLVFILNRLMFRPLLKTLNKRQARLRELRQNIHDFEHEIEQLQDELLQKEHMVRREAGRERSLMRNAGLEEAERLLNAAREKMVAQRLETDRRTEEALQKARSSVHEQAAGLVDLINELALGRRNAV